MQNKKMILFILYLPLIIFTIAACRPINIIDGLPTATSDTVFLRLEEHDRRGMWGTIEQMYSQEEPPFRLLVTSEEPYKGEFSLRKVKVYVLPETKIFVQDGEGNIKGGSYKDIQIGQWVEVIFTGILK